MAVPLDALNHDILISVFSALSIPGILVLRQASRRLYLVSEEHAVWKTACTNEIIQSGIPFPRRPLASFSAKDLELETLRAYRLGLNLKSPKAALRHVVSSPTRGGTVDEIKFLARHGRCWIITTSLSIWWTLCIMDCDSLEVVAEWNPGRALFNGLAINTDDQSDAAIAISVHRDGSTAVEILEVFEDDDGRRVTIQPRRMLNTSHKPIALNGDLVALCDHHSETLILNWKTQEQALLKSPDTWQDKPLHVAFTHGNILVVRARSICIFEEPRMVLPGDDLVFVLPRISTSFGWVDGVSLAPGLSTPLFPPGSSPAPLSLLVRNKEDDPWRPTEQFQLMTLNPDDNRGIPHASHDPSSAEHEPNSSPFNLVCSHSSRHRGPLRCSNMVLGSYGTAVWVRPSDWAATGLITDESLMERTSVRTPPEMLVVALFPGPLTQGSSGVRVTAVLENDGDSWSCLDYDETRGLIALGSGSGGVTVYRL